MDKELIVVKGKVIEQQKSYSPDSGKDIGYEAGAKMVKRHFDENPDDVIAHFMGRNLIEKILAQPGCVGIRAFHGLNEMGIRSLIVVGVDNEGKNIIELKSLNPGVKTQETKGVVMTGVKACPPYCGDSDSTETSTSWSS
jgi:hypothetical protein